jgi:hypothetical protein
MKYKLPRFAIFVHQFFHAFVDVLDALTQNQGKKIWIEKTPGHLHHINQIEKFVKGAKFIHIIRNGQDVVASLFDMGNRYPEVWGTGWSIDRCIDRWLEDVRLSEIYSTKENHTLVRYEELIVEPQPVLINLCKFINIPFEYQMLIDYSTVASYVVLDHESWKASVVQPIHSTTNIKFDMLFDENQKRYIIHRLKKNSYEGF